MITITREFVECRIGWKRFYQTPDQYDIMDDLRTQLSSLQIEGKEKLSNTRTRTNGRAEKKGGIPGTLILHRLYCTNTILQYILKILKLGSEMGVVWQKLSLDDTCRNPQAEWDTKIYEHPQLTDWLCRMEELGYFEEIWIQNSLSESLCIGLNTFLQDRRRRRQRSSQQESFQSSSSSSSIVALESLTFCNVCFTNGISAILFNGGELDGIKRLQFSFINPTNRSSQVLYGNSSSNNANISNSKRKQRKHNGKIDDQWTYKLAREWDYHNSIAMCRYDDDEADYFGSSNCHQKNHNAGSLEALHLRSCGLSDLQLSHIVQNVLTNHPGLKELYLGYNYARDLTLQVLGHHLFLPQCQLASLDLSHQQQQTQQQQLPQYKYHHHEQQSIPNRTSWDDNSEIRSVMRSLNEESYETTTPNVERQMNIQTLVNTIHEQQQKQQHVRQQQHLQQPSSGHSWDSTYSYHGMESDPKCVANNNTSLSYLNLSRNDLHDDDLNNLSWLFSKFSNLTCLNLQYNEFSSQIASQEEFASVSKGHVAAKLEFVFFP